MEEIKTIQLVNGGEAIVDASDYEMLNQFRWFKSSAGYAHRQGWSAPRKDGGIHWCIWMHREINQTPENLFTDHINGIKLDNRKCNLRNCTKSQNGANRTKQRNAESKYKGVYYNTSLCYWCARIKVLHKESVTYHKTEDQAALDYNRMAVEAFGEYAQLNIIPEGVNPTLRKQKSSQYRGVSFYKFTKKWNAALEKNGKSIFLGSFTNEIEAAKAYNAGALVHFGERARLNTI